MQPRLKGLDLWKRNDTWLKYKWSFASTEHSVGHGDRLKPFPLPEYWRKSKYGVMNKYNKKYYDFQLPGEFFC